MQLPFTAEQFFGVFDAYNTTVWPAQVLLLALAVAAIVLVGVPRRWSGAAISAILACLWVWLGLVYHLGFFAPINPLAYAFAAVSVAGAVVFAWQGVIRRRLEFNWTVNARSIVGLVLVLFALVVYPAWSTLSGHGYPALPTFGLPCPTTLFTLGLFAFVTAPYPRSPLVVPVLWCFVGAQAAFLLGVQADLGLVVAGIFGIVLLAKPGVPTQSARAAR
ncbi:MAG: DUF6064 family protein [Pyrinomonadaceae bacterium]